MTTAANQLLKEIYSARSATRAYSLRAFARDLGVSHTYLSLIFNGKKALPLSTLRSLSERLGLPQERIAPLEAKASPRSKNAFSALEIDRFRLLSRWYYIAILDLIELDSFQLSIRSAAEYLGIGTEDVKEAFSTLKRLGLLSKEKGRWVKGESRLSIVLAGSVEAIRSYHRQMISLAVQELAKTTDVEFKKRDITAMTMAINPARLPGARRKIARFRRSLEGYLTRGKRTEIYQLNVQLFPLRGGGRLEQGQKERIW